MLVCSQSLRLGAPEAREMPRAPGGAVSQQRHPQAPGARARRLKLSLFSGGGTAGVGRREEKGGSEGRTGGDVFYFTSYC